MSTVLITGGDTGIGLQAATTIASEFGLNLVLAGRDIPRVDATAAHLRATHGVKVATLELDLSSLDSVRAAAAACRAMVESGEIDSLHDPATMDGKMVGAVVEPDAMSLANQGKSGVAAISGGKRYTTSKLCTMLYAYELDRKLRRSGSSVQSIAFDPGFIPETGLTRTLPRPVQWLSRTPLMKALFQSLGVTLGSVEFSGSALARIAADSPFAAATGTCLQSNAGSLRATGSSSLSYDEPRAAKLWADSKRLVHLTVTEESIRLG